MILSYQKFFVVGCNFVIFFTFTLINEINVGRILKWVEIRKKKRKKWRPSRPDKVLNKGIDNRLPPFISHKSQLPNLCCSAKAKS